jgi:hypothetical protein
MNTDERGDPTDERLLADLTVLLGRDATPPPEVLAAARASLTWRTVDADIAALSYDSLLDEVPAAVRGVGDPRQLTFECDAVTIEMEIDDTPGGRRLIGQLTPAGPAALEVRTESGTEAVGTADEFGRFVLPLPDRPRSAHLQVTLADGTTVDSARVMF